MSATADQRDTELPPNKELSTCSSQYVRLRVCHRCSLRALAAVPIVCTRKNKTIKSLNDDNIVKLPLLAFLRKKSDTQPSLHLKSPVRGARLKVFERLKQQFLYRHSQTTSPSRKKLITSNSIMKLLESSRFEAINSQLFVENGEAKIVGR